jgi:hypothetical protein
LARNLQFEPPLAAQHPPDADTQALLHRLQNLRERWHRRVRNWQGHISEPEKSPTPTYQPEPNEGQANQALENELRELWRQLRLKQPRYGLLGGSSLSLSMKEAQALLSPGTALLEYYSLAGQLLAFVITPETAQVIQLGLDMERLGKSLDLWYMDVEDFGRHPPTETVERLERVAESQDQLAELHDLLLAPLEDALAGHQHWIIVPHQILYRLPFSALYDGQAYVGSQVEISYLPGASLLKVRNLAPKPAENTTLQPLIMAHTYNDTVPHTLQEAADIAAIFDTPHLYLQSAMTEANLRRYGSQANVIHLATHGEFKDDNPLLSWLHLDDNRLSVNDIYHLGLSHTELVTLSACETGLGSPKGGEILGLSQSFLAAGAKALLLSLWRIEDSVTRLFMTIFYRQLAQGATKLQALQTAQEEIRANHPHPFYWAGFILIGQDGKLIAEK